MSRKAQPQSKEGSYTNHSPTNGEFAKYLIDENPNCPVERLNERFRMWDNDRRKESLPRLEAEHGCPECSDSGVYYTEAMGVSRCDACGLKIVDDPDKVEY